MTTALEIPDQPGLLAPWLETQLIGLSLAEIVAGIETVQAATGGAPKNPPSISDVLGEFSSRVLAQGLQSLPHDRLRMFLRHPKLLFELQELALVDGGPYWLSLVPDPETAQHSANNWPAIETAIKHRLAVEQNVQTDKSESFKMANSGNESKRTERFRLAKDDQDAHRNRRTWLYSRSGYWVSMGLASAATIVLFIAGIQYGRNAGETAPPWGWARPGILDVALDKSEYLNHLANLASEWQNVKPQSNAELTRRLREFRRACDILLAAELLQLPDDDRVWLVERCRAWSKKFDEQINAASVGGSDFQKNRSAADSIIDALELALRQRAQGQS